MENIVEVKNLSKHYKVLKRKKGRFSSIKNFVSRDYKTIKALNNANIKIKPGEFVGIVGPNGAGKSTLVKILTGILTPTSGKVIANTYVPYESRRKYVKDIGVVFGQRTQLWWDLPVSDSFDLLRYVYRIPKKTFKKNLNSFIKILELKTFITQPVRKLSLGQRMRCDIAASLLHKPKIVFLDEPTIGLDVEAKYKIREFLKQRNKEGATIILTTHDMGDIEELCPRTIIVDHGKVIYDGLTTEIKNKISHERILIADFKGKAPKIKKERGVRLIGIQGDRVSIAIDTKKASVTEYAKKILSKYKVDDIIIQEPSVEEIIRTIYKKGI